MEEIKEIFRIKVYREFLQYKESMLRQDKTELFASCYMIEVYQEIYGILCEVAEKQPEPVLEMLYGKDNLLEWMCETWLKVEDSYYREMKEHVEREIQRLQAQGKEDDGNGRNKEHKAADGRGD